jgi:hypothetical protein
LKIKFLICSIRALNSRPSAHAALAAGQQHATLRSGRLLLPGEPLVLAFFPFREGQGALLAGSLRVEHLGLYVVPS